MNILVPVKRVVDYKVRIRVRDDGSGVDTDSVKHSMNPFDEIAVEEAVKLKQAGHSGEIIAVSIGVAKAEDVLRQALAMGADRAILILAEGRVEPLAVAKLLAAIVREEAIGLALLGKQAIDDDSGQTGQMLAALLGCGQAVAARSITIENGRAIVATEIDGGIETLDLALPAVVSTDLGLNTPRAATLPNVIKARSKPLATRTAADYGVDIAPRLTVIRTEAAPKRAPGIRVDSIAALVDELAAREALPK